MYYSLLQVDEKLVRCFSDQIFLTGFVHADPHPGNGKYSNVLVTVKSLVLKGTLTFVTFLIRPDHNLTVNKNMCR